MKTQKILAFVIAAIMAFTLCACGSDAPTPTPDNPPSTNTGDSGDLIGSGAIDPLTGADQSGNNSDPATESNADDQQPNEPSTPVPTGPEGLIIMTIQTPTGAPNNLTISSINPETGAMQTISQFRFGRIGASSCYTTPAGSGSSPGIGYYTTRREWLSFDYDKLAVSWQEITGPEIHAGWLDQSGKFFDVTAALGLGAKSDFDEPAHHEAIGFTNDDEFVYRVLVGTGGSAYWEYYSVPCDTMSADAISPGVALPGVGEDYRESNAERISDYGESGVYLADGQDGISRLHDASGNVGTYVPGTSRSSWNGVFSPDETSVAFMSCPKQGGLVDIYTMSLTGGDPIKIETDLAWATQQECKTGYYSFGNPCNMLIDWR